MFLHKPITVRGIKLRTFPLDTSPQETQLTDLLSDFINAKVKNKFETQDEIIPKVSKKRVFASLNNNDSNGKTILMPFWQNKFSWEKMLTDNNKKES